MTLTDLRDNEALRRDLDVRYPYGWRIGFDEKGPAGDPVPAARESRVRRRWREDGNLRS